MMKRRVSILMILTLSGCASSAIPPEQSEKNKDDPYKNSTVNTIRENQEIYREQLRLKGIY